MKTVEASFVTGGCALTAELLSPLVLLYSMALPDGTLSTRVRTQTMSLGCCPQLHSGRHAESGKEAPLSTAPWHLGLTKINRVMLSKLNIACVVGVGTGGSIFYHGHHLGECSYQSQLKLSKKWQMDKDLGTQREGDMAPFKRLKSYTGSLT